MRRSASLSLALAVAPLAAQTARYRDPTFAVERTLDVAFGAAVDRYTRQTVTLYLDRYQPVGDVAAARPAVVVVHGGGFVGGDKRTAQIAQLARAFAERGYLAVSIDYRLAPRGTTITQQVIDDAMEDCKAAVRYLRRQEQAWRVDVDRIASIGSSAGAFTVLAAAYRPGEGSSGNPGYSSQVAAVADLWGGLLDAGDVDHGEPPFLIVHGTADPVVPCAFATALEARAQAIGHAFELHPIAGAGHAPWGPFFTDHLDDVLAFFWQHLALDRLAGLTARPGYASPGTLRLDRAGLAGDTLLLCVAAGPASIDLGALGVLCLAPASLQFVAGLTLPATPRLPLATSTFPVPDGLAGQVLYWQELRLAPGGSPRTLSSCVETRF